MAKSTRSAAPTVRDVLGGSAFGELLLAALENSAEADEVFLDVPITHRFGRFFLRAVWEAKNGIGELLMRHDRGQRRGPVALLIEALVGLAKEIWSLGEKGGMAAEFPAGADLVVLDGAPALNIENGDQLVVTSVTRNIVRLEDQRRQFVAECSVVEMVEPRRDDYGGAGAVLKDTDTRVVFRVAFSG